MVVETNRGGLLETAETQHDQTPAERRPRRPRRITAIDGLRALAIIGVVLYHTRPALLRGGFLGVTLFFVITGFLITRSVERELVQTRRFPYARFMFRRVKRLLPAALSIIGITAVATFAVAPSLLPKIQADALPAATFTANISYIVRKVSYFDAAGLPSPLTHLWYLGLIMQFYLLWPAVIIFARKLFPTRKKALGLIALIAVASSIAMGFLYSPASGSAHAYYGLDARLAELCTGAIAALLLPVAHRAWDRLRSKPERKHSALIAGPACLAALGLGMVFADGEAAYMYRGGYLVAALACAALLLYVQMPGNLLAKPLSARPLRYLGTRSFSIYLVHYPLLILMNPATRTTALPWWGVALQLVIVLMAGELCFQIFEHKRQLRPVQAAEHESMEGNHPLVTRAAHLAGKLGIDPARFEMAAVHAGAWIKAQHPALIVRWTLAILGALVVVVLSMPLNWKAIARHRAEALRPELTQEAPQNTEKQIAAEEKAEAAANKPVAEKVPKKLPWKDWTYDDAAGTCDAPILMVGDSVTEGAAPAVQQVLPAALIDGKVSRQFWVGQDVIAQHLAEGYQAQAVVVALGTNGVIGNDNLIQAIVDACGDLPVYFVTIRCPLPLQDANNAKLRAYAAQHKNVGIIDWNGTSEGHPEYLTDDGIHLTPTGQQAYATMIRQALCGH